MARPTARVLTLLELLQSGGIRTVAELADRLKVDERTVRRYADHLIDLDVPVESVRGRYGGYRLAPGYRMPPLMLSDDEALAVLLGLVAGRRAGQLTTTGTANETATAKIRRVLPDRLARRLDAVLDSLSFTAAPNETVTPDSAVLLSIADAIRHHRPIAIRYTAGDGRRSTRTLHPYGLVVHSGRWYVTGVDPEIGEDRTFRLDRITDARALPGVFEPPADLDPTQRVLSGFAEAPYRHEVSLRIQGTVDQIRARLPASVAIVAEPPAASAQTGHWLRVELRAERLDWLPSVLASLDRPFTIERPAELRDLVAALANRLLTCAVGPVLSTLSQASWDGEFLTTTAARHEVAEDFGHVVAHQPSAVLRPASSADVATVLRMASAQGVPVTARGMGHSTFGQSQVADGVVIDMRHLAEIGPVEADRVTVGAGASWRSVVTAAVAQGRTPPVLTDYLGLSVGGTLSVGGIGGTSYRHGVQTDHVLRLEVVAGDGTVHTCAPDRETELFDSVLAGLGQHGIITQATLRLAPAPTMVRRYLLRYPTVTALAADQRTLLHERRFAYLEGHIVPRDGQWRYQLEAASYHSPPDAPADNQLLAGLSDDRPNAEIEDFGYLDFADRLAPSEAHLRSTGEWMWPHPWWNAFLPDSETDRFLDRLGTELTIEEIGASGLVLIYPVHTAALRTPLFRTPDEPVAFLVGVLRTTSPDPAAVRRAVSVNRTWYDRARAVGGTAYQVGTIPFTGKDWADHFGAMWPSFTAAKHRYDPHRILCPGQGIFAEDGPISGSSVLVGPVDGSAPPTTTPE